MRRPLIAGNWKMYKDIHETAGLIKELKERLRDFRMEVDIVISPPFTSLIVAKTLIEGTPLRLGAQNMSQHDEGAFTGEISAKMLRAIGCDYVIIGHSERRQYFKETDAVVNAKLKQALRNGLTPVVCIGETLEEREAMVTDEIITMQVKGVLHELDAAQVGKIVIAYEPVWAIGTGKTATPDQANQVHQLIRKVVSQLTSWNVAEKLIIQYGGSVNAENAASLLSQPDIDGALVGGASLKSDAFVRIIQAAIESNAN
ncbi:MAG TPA: triose-phosphate isomerase [Bacteroidota bacterium]|jgi:triosephosphate isomerase|nr:triose-phosphate isomerase [Bacteroidota bacterium]